MRPSPLVLVALLALSSLLSGCEEPVVDEDAGPNLCEGVTCQGHGACIIRDNGPYCLCYDEWQTTGEGCVPPADGGDGDGDGDADGDSDGDGDGDADGDGDGDGDADGDGDGDGDGDPQCISDVAFGTACASSGCIDGSRCERVAPEAARRQCTPSCVNDDDCPDIAPGQEACLFSIPGHVVDYCLVQCGGDGDCPCEMGCRDVEGLGMICIPISS